MRLRFDEEWIDVGRDVLASALLFGLAIVIAWVVLT